MRWILACCLVALVAGQVDAKLVIMDPPMVRKCPQGKTWAAIERCLTPHGKVIPIRQQQGVRLVKFAEVTTKNRPPRDAAILLYIEDAKGWRLAGHWEIWGDTQVLAFDRQTIGRHTGYRIELGLMSPTTVMIDDIAPVTALVRTRRVLFCSGRGHSCPDATRTCEVFVDGKAWFAFHGSLAIEGAAVEIRGDRSRSGSLCGVAPRIYHGWPST